MPALTPDLPRFLKLSISFLPDLVFPAGEVTVPKLRELTFQTAIIERYRRRESSVEEAVIEMYLVCRCGEWRTSRRRCGELE